MERFDPACTSAGSISRAIWEWSGMEGSMLGTPVPRSGSSNATKPLLAAYRKFYLYQYHTVDRLVESCARI